MEVGFKDELIKKNSIPVRVSAEAVQDYEKTHFVNTRTSLDWAGLPRFSFNYKRSSRVYGQFVLSFKCIF